MSLLIASFANFLQCNCVLYCINVLVTGSVAENHYCVKENEKPKSVSETITWLVKANVFRRKIFSISDFQLLSCNVVIGLK